MIVQSGHAIFTREYSLTLTYHEITLLRYLAIAAITITIMTVLAACMDDAYLAACMDDAYLAWDSYIE